MLNKLITLFLITLFIFAPLSPAFANPIVTGKETAFASLFFLSALVAEVTVTMLLLRRYCLRIIRLGIVYLGVNLVSFLFFVTSILPMFHGFGLFFPIPEFLAELFVILLETATLFMLVNLGWFRTENSRDLSIRSTIVAVTVGNVTSILFGFLLLLPSAFVFLNFNKPLNVLK